MKALSIIVPHKNSLFTLPRLIQSIPKCDSIEIIIVDDHSDEDVKVALEKFCAQHTMIKLLENKTDIYSAGKARNIGIQHAKGKWILFADADDYFLDLFNESIKKQMKSDFDIIYFRPEIEVNEDSVGCLTMIKVFDIYESEPNEDNLLLLKLNMVTPWSKLIKREFVEREGINFDEVLKNNDVMFSKKIALSTKNVAVDQQSIYAYTVHPFSLTKRTDLKHYYSTIDVHSRSIKYMRDELPNKRLLKVNPECFYTHYRLLYLGIKAFRSFKVIKHVLKIYRRNGLMELKYFTPILAIIGFYKKKKLFGQ